MMRSPSAGAEIFSSVEEAMSEIVDPEPSVRVEHHLDNCGIIEPLSDRGAECGTQHARAARDRLELEGMDHHFCPQALTTNRVQ